MTNRDAVLDELLGPDRPDVRAIAVTSMAGSATLSGVSGGLGNDLDAALLARARQWSDAVIVGAGTVREENYHPIAPDSDVVATRRAHGQRDTPVLAIVSGSLNFDPKAEIFTQASADNAPLILTSTQAARSAGAQRLRNAGGEVADTGAGGLAAGVDYLRSRGLTRILCEGGPSVHGAGISADLFDTFYLTVSPVISGEVETPLVASGDSAPRRFFLEHVHHSPDSLLFLRYRRADR